MSKGRKTEIKRITIKKRITRDVLLLTLVSLVILGLVSAYLNYRSANATLRQTMTETAQIAAERVEWELASYKNIAGDIGTLTRMTNAAYSNQDKQKLIDQKVAEYGLVQGLMLEKDGVEPLSGTDYSDRAYFKASMDGEIYVSEPLVSKTTGKVSIIISAPIWADGKKDTEVAGVVLIVPDEEFLNDIAKSIQISGSGSAYILDKNGNTIAHRDMELVKTASNTQNDAKTDSSLKALAALEARMVAGENGFGTYTYGGVKKFLAYAPVENSNGWSIAINAPTGEFMKDAVAGIIITAVITLLAVMAAVVIATKLAARIGNPVRECAERLELLAAGDLHSPVPVIENRDETGDLAGTTGKIVNNLNTIIGDIKFILEAMASNDFAVSSSVKESYIGDYETILTSLRKIKYSLSDTILHIREASDQVSAGAGQMAEGAQSLANGATDQAGSVEELLATVTNAASRMQEGAEQAGRTSEDAKSIGGKAQDSNKQMEVMTQAMERISDASREIANIIGSIEEIATQTNLLSLNASIEAARAGEAGRGFAVVANEISKLANQSAEAVENTRSLIDTALQEVERGSGVVSDTASSLYAVIEGIENVAASIQQVARLSREQSESMQQINEGIEQISAVVETNSSTAQESSAMSEELSAQAETLKELVGKFKIKVTAGAK